MEVVGDNERLAKPEWQYHEICLWLPHKPETVDDIANDIACNGFRLDRPIATYEGKILDGRHRYEAALKAGVDPVFVEFQGTKEEAISYVTSENVARRHLNSQEKMFFYVQRADALTNSRYLSHFHRSLLYCRGSHQLSLRLQDLHLLDSHQLGRLS